AALATMAKGASDDPRLLDGTAFIRRLRRMLSQHAGFEAAYRADSGYVSSTNIEDASAEYFSYRKSFLKKTVQQALYIDARRLGTDRFGRNATGAVAAGLAATWALVAQLPAKIENVPPAVQTVLFCLPIAAYVAKDRIKELTREWLSKRI